MERTLTVKKNKTMTSLQCANQCNRTKTLAQACLCASLIPRMPPKERRSKARKWTTNHLTWQSMSMTARKLNLTKKTMKSTSMLTSSISAQIRNPNRSRVKDPPRRRNKQTTRTTMMMRRRYLAPIIRLSLPTCLCRVRSRSSSSTSRATSPKRLTWTLNLSHSSRTTFRQLER